MTFILENLSPTQSLPHRTKSTAAKNNSNPNQVFLKYTNPIFCFFVASLLYFPIHFTLNLFPFYFSRIVCEQCIVDTNNTLQLNGKQREDIQENFFFRKFRWKTLRKPSLFWKLYCFRIYVRFSFLPPSPAALHLHVIHLFIFIWMTF